jgi:amidase
VELVDYLEAHEWLGAFSRRLLADWPPDVVLLTPTLTRLPAQAEAMSAGAGVTDDALRFSVLLRVWNVTGQPAISLPLHATADGIPVGVQLIAPPGRDDLLIALAAALEEAAGWLPR